ncbi:MAG: DUF2589 domain-containing protein [Firmicutes bacterium]|nr:DUF2589 domain-containing protein [Bacillota bacterium]
MAEIPKELNSIDFDQMIGGPLVAVIKAQAQSAQTSVDFIKSVGFTYDETEQTREPNMVSFHYEKAVEDEGNNGGTSIHTFKLDVPLLTMLPVPYIRVEEVTIDFNAKINSVEETTIGSTSSFSSSFDGSAGWGWGLYSAKLKTSYSNRRSYRADQKTERNYSMNVHVRAVQDEIPAGVDRLLSILEGKIQEVDEGEATVTT